jgi:cell wall-associated NlpC family hydrolase
MALATARRHRVGLYAIVGAALLVVPAVHASAQRPVKTFEELSSSALTLRDSIVALARAQVGRRYLHGGATPTRGFDCSGLVEYVLTSLRIDVPRTSREQSKIGNAIARDPGVLRRGDLLLFGKEADGISHIGIYVGNGRFVHASSVAGRVIESPLNRPPSALIKVFMSARRVLAGADSLPGRPAEWGIAAQNAFIPVATTGVAASATAARTRQ